MTRIREGMGGVDPIPIDAALPWNGRSRRARMPIGVLEDDAKAVGGRRPAMR
jgi:hypothetical protein